MIYNRFHDYILCNIECYDYCFVDKNALGDSRYLEAMYQLIENGDILIDKKYKKGFVVKYNKESKNNK
jgi:hypothetical protein